MYEPWIPVKPKLNRLRLPAVWFYLIFLIPAGVRAETTTTDDGGEEVIVRSKAWQPPGTVSKISKREMQEQGAVNLGEVLQNEPAAEVQQSPKDGALLQLGGFDEKSSRITIEGIPMLEVYSGTIDLSLFPVGLFQGLELERGIVSVLHGPNTQGGVLTLRLGTCNTPRAEVVVLTGKFHENTLLDKRASVSGCVRIGDWTFLGAADVLSSDGYVVSRGTETTPYNAQYHEDGGLRDGSGQQKRAATAIVRREFGFGLSVTGLYAYMQAPRNIPVHTRAGFTRYWRLDPFDSHLLGLTLKWAPSGSLLKSAQVLTYWYHHNDQLNDYEDTSYTRLTTNPVAFFQSSAYVNDSFGGFAEASWSFFPHQTLTLGTRYDMQIHRAREKPVPAAGENAEWFNKTEMANHIVTLAAENTHVLAGWRFSEGVSGTFMQLLMRRLRDEAYAVEDDLMPGVEARLIAEREWKHTRLSFGVGHKLRFPMLREMFSNRVGGNPELEPERAWMLEASIASRQLFFPGLSGSMRLFANRVEGLIERWGDTFQNLDDAVIAGQESELRWTHAKKGSLFVRGRTLIARDLDSGEPLVNRTPHKWMLGARQVFPAGFSAGMELDFRSTKKVQYYDMTDGLYRNADSRGRLLWHARVRYDFAVSTEVAMFLMLSGRNLLDTHYEDGSFEPRPGREIWLTLGANL